MSIDHSRTGIEKLPVRAVNVTLVGDAYTQANRGDQGPTRNAHRPGSVNARCSPPRPLTGGGCKQGR